MIRVLPGDPLATLLGAQGSNPADREALARTLGFDEPMPVQYVHWLGRLVTGDLGYSYVRHYAVSELIGAAFTRTLVLAGAAALIGLTGGIALGAAAHADRELAAGTDRGPLHGIPDPAVYGCFEAAIVALQELGASVVEVSLPLFDEVQAALMPTCAAESLAYHMLDARARWGDYFEGTRAMLARGALVSGADYVQAQRVRRVAQHQVQQLFGEAAADCRAGLRRGDGARCRARLSADHGVAHRLAAPRQRRDCRVEVSAADGAQHLWRQQPVQHG
jgi:hypothetical protein